LLAKTGIVIPALSPLIKGERKFICEYSPAADSANVGKYKPPSLQMPPENFGPILFIIYNIDSRDQQQRGLRGEELNVEQVRS
jgi:hypothetical protein